MTSDSHSGVGQHSDCRQRHSVHAPHTLDAQSPLHSPKHLIWGFGVCAGNLVRDALWFLMSHWEGATDYSKMKRGSPRQLLLPLMQTCLSLSGSLLAGFLNKKLCCSEAWFQLGYAGWRFLIISNKAPSKNGFLGMQSSPPAAHFSVLGFWFSAPQVIYSWWGSPSLYVSSKNAMCASPIYFGKAHTNFSFYFGSHILLDASSSLQWFGFLSRCP